jgi:hypothetical protein
MQDNGSQEYICRDIEIASLGTGCSGGHPWCTIMPHEATNMTKMQGRPQSLCEGVSRVDDARDVTQYDVAICLPLLNRKELDVNVMRPRRGATGIYH